MVADERSPQGISTEMVYMYVSDDENMRVLEKGNLCCIIIKVIEMSQLNLQKILDVKNIMF